MSVLPESGNLVTQAEAAERRLVETGAASAPPQGETVAGALVRIVQQNPNMDLEKVRGMMEIAREWEGEEARKAYLDALARAQASMAIVAKQQESHHGKYADYGAVVRTIAPVLAREGLSFDHEIQQEGATITVSCVLSHEAGHSRRVTMSAPPDDSGKKNAIQQIRSTVKYLQRATLEVISGAATGDGDDDGNSFATELISDEQREGLEKQLDELGATDDDRAKFLSFLAKKTKREIETLADLPTTALPAAKQALAAKRKAQDEAKPEAPSVAWFQAKDGSGRYECHGGDPASPEAKDALFKRLSADLAPPGGKWTPDEASIAREIAEANAALIGTLPDELQAELQAAWAEIPE